MIRDPSDGTIKELWENPTTQANSKQVQSVELTGNSGQLDANASGLPTDKLKADELARLERAREWLKEWKGRNGT